MFRLAKVTARVFTVYSYSLGHPVQPLVYAQYQSIHCGKHDINATLGIVYAVESKL